MRSFIFRNKISSYRAFYLATLGGARALRIDQWLGNFQKGKEADFIVLDLEKGAEELTTVLTRINEGVFFPRTLEKCAESLFAVIAMGDSRIIDDTWIYGKSMRVL